MMGLPEGPMQFEDDLAQIKRDVSMIQNDLFWMSQFGGHVLNIMMELRYIRRLMETNLGEITREDAAKEFEEDNRQVRQFEEENQKRMRMRVDQG